jgi:ATP-dependent protease Clp ATPase subunit
VLLFVAGLRGRAVSGTLGAMLEPRPQRCSFCGADPKVVRFLVAGPEVFICDKCIGAAAESIATAEPQSTATDRESFALAAREIFCSFCGKNSQEVKRIAARERSAICDDCLRTSLDIVLGDGTTAPKVVYF